MKNQWEYPVLIEIIKTELEEDVLSVCKRDAPVKSGGCDDETSGPLKDLGAS